VDDAARSTRERFTECARARWWITTTERTVLKIKPLAQAMDIHTRRSGVASMLRDGADVAEIADILAVPRATIRRDAIITAVHDGHTPAQIARTLGISRAYAARVAAAQRPDHARIIAARSRRVDTMTRKGKSIAAIAAALHVSARTVAADRAANRR